jgi:hypothetical protein
MEFTIMISSSIYFIASPVLPFNLSVCTPGNQLIVETQGVGDQLSAMGLTSGNRSE